jgi:hypothetical protein
LTGNEGLLSQFVVFVNVFNPVSNNIIIAYPCHIVIAYYLAL